MDLEYTNPLLWGIPCFIALALGEMAYSHAHGDDSLYDWRDVAVSSSLGLGAILITALLQFISAATLLLLTYDYFNPEVDGVRYNIMGYQSFGWSIGTWLLCQLLDDFSYYWRHRFNHTVRFMWAAHLVHHSSDHYNFSIGFRNGWFTVIYKPVYYLWLAAIGFHPEMILVCMGIESLWLFQLHTSLVPKLGWLEKVINSHKQHEVHHATNLEYLDKNHGGILNVFDRLFGTWQPYDEAIAINYGMLHRPRSDNPLEIVTHEYKNIWADVKGARNPYEIFMYIFGEPGWSPDGSTLTVKQLQRQRPE